MSECVFCKIEKKNYLFENNSFFAIHDLYPVTPGHILVITKDHVENYNGLSKTQKIDLIEMIDLAKDYILKNQNTEFYNIGVNTGKPAGQTVMHFHLHVIPRTAGDHSEPEGGVRGVISEKQKY